MPQLSYAKCLVLAWAILLVTLCFKQVFYVMGAVSALLTLSLLPTADGDAKLLVPLFFLSERLLVDSTSLRHSPVMFLSCALFAYAADATNTLWISVGYGVVGIVAMYGLTSQLPLALALGAYFAVALASYSQLKKRVTTREAIIVSHLFGFLACDALVNTNVEPSAFKELTITSYTHIGGRCSLLMALAVAASCFAAGKVLAANIWHTNQVVRTIFFVGVTAATIFKAYTYCAALFREDPAVWLIEYVGSSPVRFLALFSWIFGIPLCVRLADRVASRNSLPLIVYRKVFHLIAVVFFLPVGIYDPEFLGFSVMLATSIGILLETARMQRLYGTQRLNRFILSNIDARDGARLSGTFTIVRTHLFLLFGLSLPIILHARQQQMVARPLAPIVLMALFLVPGVIGLGVMDAAAATFGTYARRWRIGNTNIRQTSGHHLSNVLCNKVFTKEANPALTHKTFEGSLGGLVTAVAAWSLVVLYAFGFPSYFRTIIPSIAGLVLGAVFEASVDGVDNLELPIFMAGVIQTSVLVLGQYF